LSDITVKRPVNDARTTWETVDSEKTLLELGFTQKNAKPDDPAPLAYTIPGQFCEVKIPIKHTNFRGQGRGQHRAAFGGPAATRLIAAIRILSSLLCSICGFL
jgi:hypothetical protein